jgi:EpsI family protein
LKSVSAASAIVVPEARATSSLRIALVVLGCSLVLLLGIVHRATAASLWESWTRDPFGHGYFVVPAVLFLAYHRRASLVSLNLRPALLGLPVLALVSFAWLLGNLTSTLLIQQSSLVLMGGALAWIVLGTAAVRALLFPLGLLVFAPPWGDRLAPTLQDVTALAVLKMLALSDVHPILQGQVISIDGNRWRVTEACGGINYFVASLLVGYLYAGLVYRQWGHRLAFVGAAALVPLVANGVRVYTTILLDHYGASRLVSGMEHYLYGVLIFGIVMTVLFLTCGRWREDPPSSADSAPRTASSPAPARTGTTVLCAATAMLLMAMGPVSARVLSQRSEVAGTIRHYAAEASPPWRTADGNAPEWSSSLAAVLADMRQTAPVSEVHQSYTDGSRSAALHITCYAATQAGVKLVSKSSLPSPWWSARQTRRMIELPGNSVRIKEQVLRSPRWSLVVWSWYQIGQSVTANDYAAKLFLGKSRLLLTDEDAAAIVVATEELPGVDATAILYGFVAHLAISETGLEPAR